MDSRFHILLLTPIPYWELNTVQILVNRLCLVVELK